MMDGDLSKVCRLCLKGGEVMCPIFGSSQHTPTALTLSQKIMSCAQVKLLEGDGLPTNVCTSCLSQVDRSYQFKILCEKSDNALRGSMKAEVKEEESDNESLDGGDMWDMTKFTPEVIIKEENDDNQSLVNGGLEEGLPDERFYPMTQVEEILRRQGTKIEMQQSELLGHHTTPTNGFLPQDEGMMPLSLEGAAAAAAAGIMAGGPPFHPEGARRHPDTPAHFPNGFTAFLPVPPLQPIDPGPSPKSRRCRGGDKLFKCRQCNKSYSFSSALSRHKAVHNTALRPHVCQICNKGFTQLDKLLRHQKTHSLSSALICDLCGRAFTSYPAFQKHRSYGNCIQLSKCPDCHVELPKDLLESHKCQGALPLPPPHQESKRPPQPSADNGPQDLSTTPASSTPTDSNPRNNKGKPEFQCNVCQKNFATRGSLEVHSTIHTGLRPFVCGVCQKSFRHKVNLMEHFQRKHSQVRPYICDVCASRFVTKQELVRHYRKHIGD